MLGSSERFSVVGGEAEREVAGVRVEVEFVDCNCDGVGYGPEDED